MKKTLLLFAVVICSVSILVTHNNKSTVKISDLLLANVEALADDTENIPTIPCCQLDGSKCVVFFQLADGTVERFVFPHFAQLYWVCL